MRPFSFANTKKLASIKFVLLYNACLLSLTLNFLIYLRSLHQAEILWFLLAIHIQYDCQHLFPLIPLCLGKVFVPFHLFLFIFMRHLLIHYYFILL